MEKELVEEPSDYDTGLPPMKEKKLGKGVRKFLNCGAVLRKFQPDQWAVLEPKSPCGGGQHLTDTGLLIIPATLRHWLGTAMGKYNLNANVVIDFRVWH